MARAIGSNTHHPRSSLTAKKTLWLIFALAASSIIYNSRQLIDLQGYITNYSDESFNAPLKDQRTSLDNLDKSSNDPASDEQTIVLIDDDGAVETARIADDDTSSTSTEHPHVYKWEDLEQRFQEGHGELNELWNNFIR